jgi:hypothetical protein
MTQDNGLSDVSEPWRQPAQKCQKFKNFKTFEFANSPSCHIIISGVVIFLSHPCCRFLRVYPSFLSPSLPNCHARQTSTHLTTKHFRLVLPTITPHTAAEFCCTSLSPSLFSLHHRFIYPPASLSCFCQWSAIASLLQLRCFAPPPLRFALSLSTSLNITSLQQGLSGVRPLRRDVLS